MSSSSTKLPTGLAMAQAWLSPRQDLREAVLVDDLVGIAESRVDLGVTSGWMLARASPHPEVARSFSFLLTNKTYGRLEDRFGALLDLISTPPTQDPSTLINLLTAVRRTLPDCELGFINLIGIALPPLIKTAFQSVPLAAEAAIDLLNEIESDGLAPLMFGPMERAELIGAKLPSNPYLSQIHVDELSRFKERLGRTRKKAGTDFEFSPLVRFQETIRRLLDAADAAQWRDALGLLARDYGNRLRYWGLLADARRLDTQVHQLRVMSRNGSTPSFDVVSRIVQLWQTFVSSFSPTKEPGFRPFATANGSFVLNLAVTSAPVEIKKVLTRASVLEFGAHEASEVPPAWFDLCTLLVNEKLRVECSIADMQTEPFHVFRAIEPEKRPPPPVLRKQKRWKWDLRSIDVPQADRIERVFRVAELISQGEEPTAEELEIEPRQVAYYRRAAISLGLITESSQLTVAGERLVSLRAPERLSLAAVLFETSACGGAWTDWAGSASLADVKPETAKQFLIETVNGLNDVTAGRRAKTLSTWHRTLMSYHYKRLELPAHSSQD